MKDSLWSIDLFCCESIHLHTHWVMVVMDQFSRQIVGFAVHQGYVSGVDLCCMFSNIILDKSPPKCLSTDNDPLFTFHRWQANLRILEIEPIKSVPYIPISHPFIERLIGTVRRELLDQTLFWNTLDLENKLQSFQIYYNNKRGHLGIEKQTPYEKIGRNANETIELDHYRWEKQCHGLFQLPMTA